MKNKLKQLIALILAMSMCLSLLSANVCGEQDSEGASVSAQSSEEPAPEEGSSSEESASTEGEEPLTTQGNDPYDEDEDEDDDCEFEPLTSEQRKNATPVEVNTEVLCDISDIQEKIYSFTTSVSGKYRIEYNAKNLLQVEFYYQDGEHWRSLVVDPAKEFYTVFELEASTSIYFWVLDANAPNDYSFIVAPEDKTTVPDPGESGNNIASGTCGENVNWTLDDAGKLTISGTGEMQNYYRNYVGYNTYLLNTPWDANKDSIQSVVIEAGVTSIGESAFLGCTNLMSITIPDSVISIGWDAFSECSNLTSITIPESVTSIGESAFSECMSLTSVTIPNSVTSIESYLFCGCTSLMRFTIPNSVSKIGYRAFDGCTSLTNITIPDSVTSIGLNAFSGCTSLTSVTIPSSVTSIVQDMFRDCESLTSVTIPNSVTSIDYGAFQYCSNLTNITIPDSVTSIGNSAFFGCTSLTSITIPSSVTSIGDCTFDHCESLTSVTIPNSVTSIAFMAFNNCTSLKSATIPRSVTDIGYCAFDGCENLSDVYYKGSEDDWNAITIGSGNEKLAGATIHYNSSSQDDYQDTGSFSSDNLPQYPSDGKDEWVIFKEGSRNNRVEMSTFTLTSNSSNMRIVWNKGLSVSGSSTIDSCNQYYLSTEGKWAYLGEYGLLSDWATGVIASSLDVYDSNGNLIIERSDIYRKNSSYIDKSKIWSFANWRTEFPMASNGYYMSDEDFKKLMGGLNNIDRKLVAGDLMYHAAHTDFVGYTTEGIWTEKINVGSRGRPHTDEKEINGNTATWHGSCRGMSVLDILLNNGVVLPSQISEGAGQVSEITNDKQTASAINFYHMQQRTSFMCSKAEEMYKIGEEKGQLAQLKVLEEYGKKTNKDGLLFLISYSWYNKNEKNEWIGSSHAVVGYGYETGSWKFSGHQYSKRILTYDCSNPYSNQELTHIYYNDEGLFSVPGRNIFSTTYVQERNAYNNGRLKLVLGSAEELNCVDYGSGKPSNNLIDNTIPYYIITKIGDCLTIKDLDGDKNVWRVYTEGYTKDSRGYFLNTFVESYDESDPTAKEQVVVLPDRNHSYQIISEDQNLDCQIVFGNYLADVSCNSAGAIDISPQGDITVSTETKAYINLEITSNTYYGAEDWYTVQVHAEDASGIKVNQSEGGVSVQSDAEKPVHLAAGTDSEYAETYSDNTNKGVVFTPDYSGRGIVENPQDGSNNTEGDDNSYRQKNRINGVNSITRTANIKKNQSFKLNASANGAILNYKSSNKNVTVKNGKVTIKKGFVGKATITITSAETEKYLPATKKVTVTVNPSATQISSVKWNKKKKVANVVWKKNTTGKGYQLQCSTSKNFKKNVKTWKIKDKKTVKASIKGLKKGTYYLRIRTVNGKCYSKWSKTKTIKIAK